MQLAKNDETWHDSKITWDLPEISKNDVSTFYEPNQHFLDKTSQNSVYYLFANGIWTEDSREVVDPSFWPQ